VASDGLQAVQQAEELRPDLILLDLGLPILNGIEAARRIRELSPNSKILFFTQNCSREIAEGALGTGANGYLLKSDATDLLWAVDTVLKGEQFVSSRVLQN
jgi:DNA-binding NarL/FixJ family response regulator